LEAPGAAAPFIRAVAERKRGVANAFVNWRALPPEHLEAALDVLPHTDLLSNIEYSGCRFSYPRECHHGTENLWGFVETAEACFNEVHHPVQVREHLVPDVVLADVFPDMLGWVQLRAVGWQRYQGHVGWDHEVVGFVPSGAIEQHDAVFTGELC
jgi:hypothetical protein